MSTSWAGRRLLVVVAHPDDETFGCGSLIADAAAAGARVTVCCATRGEAGETAQGCDLRGRPLADVRVEELQAAGRALGAAEPVLLDFVDSGMTGDASEETLFAAPFDSVVEAVTQVVADVDPDVVVTLDPTGGDGHRDHVRIAQATVEAVRRSARVDASLYCWCVPRSLLTRWLQRLTESRPDSGHLELEPAELGRPDDEITTVIDVGHHLALRRKAMALHASQRSPLDDMPEDLADTFLRFDRLVRIQPPWGGGAVETEIYVPDGGTASSLIC
ncbi:MAG TPA: PIG-L deacetylase family protein [Acidimicrobiales bacterium]|nr:PIG-L deacetylase family protein [Acidimicrobiales bacterium]